MMGTQEQPQAQTQTQTQPQPRVVERLNPAVQQQLNLDSVRTRAISLFKAISRILEDFDAIARTNSTPKWHDVLGQFSMVNLELYNIVEDIKNVSKAFIVHPKNVNAENATILPVMLSSKLLPEMETEDNTKKEQLLQGMQALPIALQIEKLKGRVDAIAAACESAEKIIAETRKAYFGTRQGPNVLPAIDKAQTAKIQEQENLLRSAVNNGEGLRLPSDQRQVTTTLPMHLADVFSSVDGVYSFSESPGMFQKSAQLIASGNINTSLLQGSGSQLTGRTASSQPGAIGNTTFDNTTASPMQYGNSPKSGTNIVNMPSPQQHQQLQRQMQKQKIMQLPSHQQQLLNQPQLRPSSVPLLGQNQLSQLPDIPSQTQQKFQSMHGQQHLQYPQQSLVNMQSRQLTSAPMHMGQTPLTQGGQLNRQLNQFSGSNNSLYNAAQSAPQMIPNISAMMPTPSILPRIQHGMAGVNRTLPSQNLSDQMFNLGTSNAGGMMPMQQQGQHGNPSSFASQVAQNLQATMQNAAQTHPNFQHQRPRSQQ